MAQRLTGAGVWITRPLHQAESLAKAIEAQGGEAICLPVIAIEDVEDPRDPMAIVERLDSFDLAIFVSANAVARGLGYVESRGNWPAQVQVAAIGKATARALASAGLVSAVQSPPPYNSEALLTTTALQADAIAGRRVVIFRGVGGRALLGDTLAHRGALVTYAEVYRRTRPRWRQTTPIPWDRIQVIVVTSAEGLGNLFGMMNDDAERERLREIPLVVISERMGGLVRELGSRCPPIVAERASNEAILDALLAFAPR
uniref:Uroporphyrinogen-III synthase n=1 Tax=Candidatus Kentrum sp. FM TaxID=2126340 RepID=A0A450WB78_9GAMM|nr:MAG: uroporphyrinogen-III synthase [Candidatus Kentron sp. FM]VFJ63083.1 MAG: uroporphyrinogen-III synthase [Candidatus Kentron sp. FM]VFK14326.1 MAG: uroporphyrinogen-III synthase [Candidatus Kentron sp. FM]